MNDAEIKAQIAALPRDFEDFDPPLEFTVPVPDHWHGPMFARVVDGKPLTDPRLCLCPSTCSARNRGK